MQTPTTTGLIAVIPDFIVTWLLTFHNQYPFVGLLMLLMFFDVVTGLIAAFIDKTLNSSASWVGMGKKVVMLLAVSMGIVLEPYCGLPLGRMVAIFYSVTEGISITENMARSGVPVPQAIKDALAKLKEKEPSND